MTAFNIVRAVVKPDHEKEFLEYQRNRDMADYKGMRAFNLVKTGEREYFFVGEWDSMDALAASRPVMISTLDHMRPWLEDLGGDLGVTEPFSGEAVVTRAT